MGGMKHCNTEYTCKLKPTVTTIVQPWKTMNKVEVVSAINTDWLSSGMQGNGMIATLICPDSAPPSASMVAYTLSLEASGHPPAKCYKMCVSTESKLDVTA